MSIIDRLAERMGYTKASYSLAPWQSHTASIDKLNIPNMAVAENQAELYRRLSWVAIAVEHVAQGVAGVPMEVVEMEGEDEKSVPNHPFEKLLMRPNPAQSRFEFLVELVMYWKLTGNSYVWLNKANENDEPVEIWTIPAYRIRPVPDEKMYIKGYLYDPGDGTEIPLEPWEVAHLKRPNPRNRYLGLSPIEALAVTATGDMKMQEWNTNFFGKNNAKMPGILTFSDMLGDNEWEKVKYDFNKEAGGTKRNMMMLRGVGEGGVNWVATAMSQKDMEFLAAREFNKQEIFDLMAPGLTSWLAVNSTEANSKTGRDAFNELAIWPALQAIQEKFSNDIMPVYGDNYKCKFEDVRPKDMLLKLRQQEQYERTHTIAEVRKEFYGDEPLGDERDNLLINQNAIGNIDTNNDGEVDTAEQFEQSKSDEVHERNQFHRFAKKNTPDKIKGFKFKYLDYPEQRALIEQYTGESELIDNLTKAIEGLYAETS